MKIGIIGLPGSGKTTIFEALTASVSSDAHKGEPRLGTVRVPDERVDILSDMYKPKKSTYAQVEYFLPGRLGQKEGSKEQSLWNQARDCDALIYVIRNFGGYGYDPPQPLEDFRRLDEELYFSDLVVAEKRLERLTQDKQKGRQIEQEELDLVAACHAKLEGETPLRRFPELAASPRLRGFTFLSAKPILVLFNNEDEDDNLPEIGELAKQEVCLVMRGKLESELAQMSPEEAAEFLAEFNIKASAMDRVITQSYDLLGLISFFTVGEDEVRAWTIRHHTPAPDAADVIHSDMKKGFIRAEVISYQHLMEAGNYSEARKRGTVRLEGKTYEVQDGDIINVRFNV